MNYKHGATVSNGKTPEYYSWTAMQDRCYQPTHKYYKNYGGRGIRVCEKWRWSFAAFLEDMGPKPRGFTLDRIDMDGDYEPDNCRWASRTQQARNTRTNKFVTHHGTTMCITEWAEKSGIKAGTLWWRLKAGWTFERAINTPARKAGGDGRQ